jgi:hypothetical protein
MKQFSVVLKEALFVGIVLILLVYLVGFGMRTFGYPMGGADAEICKNWNKSYYMEVCLLLSGMLFHIGCEYTGLNEYYAKNYFL